jgi:hypothetical protein
MRTTVTWAAVLACGLAPTVPAAGAEPPRKPNVVVILADDKN